MYINSNIILSDSVSDSVSCHAIMNQIVVVAATLTDTQVPARLPVDLIYR